MDEKKKSKFLQIKIGIKEHKKSIITIFIAIALIIFFAVLISKFISSKPNNSSTEPVSNTDLTAQTVSEPVLAPTSEKSSSVNETTASEITVEQSSKDITSASAAAEVNVTEKETQLSSINVQSGAVQKTGYKPLDDLTSKILSDIIYSGMSSNAKLNAVFNYVRNSMTYNMFSPTVEGVYDELISLGYSEYDSGEISLAYDAATSHQGVCDNYAALTMVLARAAGIPLYQYGGLSADGSSHAWNILFADGEKYLIDTNFGIFMKKFSSSGYTEQMNGKNYFNNFSTYTPPVEEKK